MLKGPYFNIPTCLSSHEYTNILTFYLYNVNIQNVEFCIHLLNKYVLLDLNNKYKKQINAYIYIFMPTSYDEYKTNDTIHITIFCVYTQIYTH